MSSSRAREYQADLEQALRCLRAGGVILYPTDTIWGLGCDARNEDAVRRIFKIKQREDSKSLLSLVADFDMIYRYLEEVPPLAEELDELAVRPLTIIYPGARGLAPSLVAADGSIGMRVTREPFSRDLCRALGAPLVSTSANISGTPAPSFYGEISEEILQEVDYAVFYKREDKTKACASQIIALGLSGEVKVIRQ